MIKHTKKCIHYGEHGQQFSQLIKPTCDNKFAVAIVIHGGYWKDSHTLETYATSEIVKYLQEFDIAIWNLEYRRMNVLGENIKAPWPIVFNDVAKGIDFLNEIKDQENLDLSRVLIIGHSAGGLLATWAASRLSIPRTSKLYAPTPLKISAVLSIAGILDLSSPQDIDQPNQINRLMGGTREQYPERYRACDPNLLSPAECKLTVFHGEQDKCVGINQAINYCKNAKVDITQIFLPDADHFSMLPHEGNWQVQHWQQLKDEIAKQITVLTS